MANQRFALKDAAPTSPVDKAPVASTPRNIAVVGQRGRRLKGCWDWLFGADPGLMQLRSAAQAVLSIGLALAFGGLFVHLTGALEVGFPAGGAVGAVTTTIHQQRHGAVVSGMLLGAAMAVAISFTSGTDRSLRREVVTALLTPVVMFAAIAACLPVAAHRVLMFVLLAVFAGIGMYLRRYGARAAALGMLVWAGVFAAFFVRGSVSEGQVGWVAAELGLGAVVTIVVRVTVFLPRWRLELRLTSRSMVARQRTALRLAAKHLERPTRRCRPVLERKLLRLNETALMIDGRTARSPDDQAELGASIARSSFLADLSISRLAELVVALPSDELTDDVRQTMACAVRALAEDKLDWAVALIDGLDSDASSSSASSDGVQRVRSAALRVVEARLAAGAPAVGVPSPNALAPLIAGWLPGSALVSGRASLQPGRRWLDRVAVASPLRSAIQLVIAMSLAIVAGDAINGGRFYWAMLAVFVAFMGGNNSYENLRRSLSRVGGTTLGIFVGFGAAGLIGDRTPWSVTLVLVALFFGFYLTRISYFFFVIGITLTVSQIYWQLGEYTHHLLYLRLEETAAGSAIAIIVLLLVVPLRRSRVFTVALASFLEEMESFLRSAKERPATEETGAALRADIRRIDASYQTLYAIGRPAWFRLSDRAFGTRTNVLKECRWARNAARAWSQDLCAPLTTTPPTIHGADDRSRLLATELQRIRDSLVGGSVAACKASERRTAPSVMVGSQSPATADDYLFVIGASVRHLAKDLAAENYPHEKSLIEMYSS